MILELKDGSRVFVGSMPQTKEDILSDVVAGQIQDATDEEQEAIVSWLVARASDESVSALVDKLGEIEGKRLSQDRGSSDWMYDAISEAEHEFLSEHFYRPGFDEFDIDLERIDQMYGNVSL